MHDDSGVHVIRLLVSARALPGSAEFAPLARRINMDASQGLPFFLTGQAQMLTRFDADISNRVLPAVEGDLVCVHDGVVLNAGGLRQRCGELKRSSGADAELIISLVNYFRGKGEALPASVASAFSELEGANSFALTAEGFPGVFLASSNGSLFYALEGGAFAFASERYILKKAIEESTFATLLGSAEIRQLKPGSGVEIAADGERFVMTPLSKWGETGPVSVHAISASRGVSLDEPRPEPGPLRPPVVAGSSYKELERLCEVDTSRIGALRRCSRCLLPETFPFIKFDDEGVCNYCARYLPWRSRGMRELEELVAPLRKSEGEPDCLVPVSGGRDSSYALHVVKRVLRMNPVAYTYDWGMVTDLARRNISRMCGELGVEHVLVAADIEKKLANVGKNVLAWLRKPHLGTVTLFMAGDKPFFHYAQLLRKRMNLGAAVFGMNNLERTDFKVGFCGIDVGDNSQGSNSLSMMDKVRMLLFFARRGVENPGLLNSSVFDSLKGFAAFYLLPKDFIPLYDFVRWDERTLSETLVKEYGWETAGDTSTTWRIGDGTASFYNYIYYRVAGFSEHDTFRSNQIREGMIDRRTALSMIDEENRPRVESIKWYCDTIGIDAVEAVKSINRMNALY